MVFHRTPLKHIGAANCLFLVFLSVPRLFAQVGPPPMIVSQPLNQAVGLGASAQFTVTVQSGTPVTFRWYVNGNQIPGAASATLIVPNAHWGDHGHYVVAVQNTAGTVMSNPALLTVTNIPLRLLATDASSEGFRMKVNGPRSSRYVVEASADCSAWMPISTNTALSGSIEFIDREAPKCPSRVYRSMVLESLLEQNSQGGTQESLKLGSRGAQSFCHGAAGSPQYRIRRVVLYVLLADLIPGSKLTVSLGTGPHSAPLPGSQVEVDPAQAADRSGGTVFVPVEIRFPSPVGPLSPGTTYYVNLASDGLLDGALMVLERASGDAYSMGTFYRDGIDMGRDLRFEIWGN